jgi:DNA polymerase, archaea type
VLLDEHGEMTIRGSGLKSRGLERFQRDFMRELFKLLLEDRRDEIARLYQNYRARIERHEIGIADLMKTETLQDSPELYRDKLGGKRRNISASYELALKDTRPYLSGDQISYYITGWSKKIKVNEAAKMAAEYDPQNPDENVAYYLAKLADLYEKFRPFAERDGLFDPIVVEDVDDEAPVQSELFADIAVKYGK